METICFVSLSSSKHFIPVTWYFASFGLRTAVERREVRGKGRLRAAGPLEF
jgi:hypothetical protein